MSSVTPKFGTTATCPGGDHRPLNVGLEHAGVLNQAHEYTGKITTKIRGLTHVIDVLFQRGVAVAAGPQLTGGVVGNGP